MTAHAGRNPIRCPGCHHNAVAIAAFLLAVAIPYYLATTIVIATALLVALVSVALVPGRNVEAALVAGVVMFGLGGLWPRVARVVGLEEADRG